MEQAILDALDAELTPTPLTARPDGLLFHYAEAAGLHGILSTKEIWATHYRHLNDSAEVVAGERLLLEVARTLEADGKRSDVSRWLLREFIARYDDQRLTKRKDVFIASFSEKGNLLSQWRAYAAGGGGYSIGLARIPTPAPGSPTASVSMDLVRCEYQQAVLRRDAAERLGALADRFDAEAHKHAKDESEVYTLAGLFVPLLFRHSAMLVLHLKDAAFEEEREWRLVALASANDPAVPIQFRFSSQGLIPYIALPLTDTSKLTLSKVYVGPSQDPDRGCSTAAVLLDRLGYVGKDIVTPSGIPLRSGA